MTCIYVLGESRKKFMTYIYIRHKEVKIRKHLESGNGFLKLARVESVRDVYVLLLGTVFPMNSKHLNCENSLKRTRKSNRWRRCLFKFENFYFAQVLTEIVEKQHVLTPSNFFFKFSHCLTLFPIFSVHVY